VVDPLPRRRHKRFRPELLERLETLLAGTPEDVLLTELDRRGPLPAQTIITECGLPTKVASEALLNLFDREDVFLLAGVAPEIAINWPQAKNLVVSRAGWASLLGRIKGTLADYHHRFPLRVGMPRSELKSQLKMETRLFNEAIQRAEVESAVQTTDTTIYLNTHKVKFSAKQETAIQQVLANFRREPYSTPSPKEVSAALGEDVMLALIEGKSLTRLSSDVLLLTDTYNEFIAWLKKYLLEHQTVNVAQVRDHFKTSRKYALALLEYTDEQRLTRRVGDDRVLRS
jgi:selenocysteine-specific elongation factor